LSDSGRDDGLICSEVGDGVRGDKYVTDVGGGIRGMAEATGGTVAEKLGRVECQGAMITGCADAGVDGDNDAEGRCRDSLGGGDGGRDDPAGERRLDLRSTEDEPP